MGTVLPHESATLAVELTAGQERKKPETIVRETPEKPLLKKAIKGGGRGRRPGKKRVGKKKVVEEGKEGGSGENVVMKAIKDVVVVADPINGSPGDAEASVGGESGGSEYEHQSPVAKSSAGKVAPPKTTSTRKTAGTSKRRYRRLYGRRSSAGKSQGNKRGKRTPGRKEKAMAEDSAGGSSIHLVDPEDGYYPDDDNDEDYTEAPKASRTPAKRVSKKVADGPGEEDSSGRTTRGSTSDQKVLAGAADRRENVSATGGRAPIAFESVHEQEVQDVDMMDCEIIEPVRTVGTKRQARESLDGGFKKVARTTAGKKFAAIKEGLQTMVIDDSDLDEPEEPSSQPPPYSNIGYSAESGYSEQLLATQPRSVVQSEPVIGRGRLRYGGKSVAGLRALWEMGMPGYLK